MQKGYLVGRGVCAFVALYHLLIGALLVLSGEMSIALAARMGMTIEGSQLLGVIGEILGCYIIAFGFMMAITAWDPIKNRAMLTVGIILVVLRLIQRLVFMEKVIDTFQMTSAAFWRDFIIVAILGLGLLAFRLMILRDSR